MKLTDAMWLVQLVVRVISGEKNFSYILSTLTQIHANLGLTRSSFTKVFVMREDYLEGRESREDL